MKKKILSILLMVSILSSYMVMLPTKVDAVTISGINYVFSRSSTAYDIQGVINGSTTLSTTYNNNGYSVFFKVGTTEQEITNISNGGSKTIDGVTLTITGVKANTTTANINYKITNTTSTSKSYSIATTADIKLGSNDKAAVYKIGHQGIQLTQDNSSNTSDYGTQVVLSFSPEATTSWVGKYGDRNNNKYVDGTTLSYTYVESVDTGMAFSWSGTIGANATKTYTSSSSTKLTQNGNINFYRYGSSSPEKTSTALIGGTVVAPSLSSATGYTYTWNTKQDGTGVSYNGNQGIIVESSNMNVYEIRTPNIYTITLNNQSATSTGTTSIYETYNTKYSLTSGGSAMTTTSNKITVPIKTKYIFGGYYTGTNGSGTKYIDENGYITSNASTTNFTAAGTLYAKWTAGKYTITLNENGGTINGTPTTSYTYGESVTLPTNVTRTGYLFDGWYATSGHTGDKITTIATTDYGNKEYWAKWIKIVDTPNIEIDSTYDYIYDKATKQPTVVVKDGNTTIPSSEYTVSYQNNVSQGTAKVIITNKNGGYYKVNGEKTFQIAAKSIEDSSISVRLSKTEYTYGGEKFEPVVTVQDTENGTTTLVLGTDYSIHYQNNINAGTATVRIVGMNNYTGETSKTFTIHKLNAINPTMKSVTKNYDGSAITIETSGGEGGTIYYATSENGTTWSEWTTTVPSRTMAGTTYVKAYVKGDANHNDTTETNTYTLVVNKIRLTITANEQSKIYHDEDPTLTYHYSNNVSGETPKFTGNLERQEGENVGRYTINQGTLALVDNENFKAENYEIIYTGNTLTIKSKPIKDFEAVLSQTEYTYHGEANTPTVTLRDTEKDTTLVLNTDYTVTYENNQNVGTGIVTITASGNYTGEIKREFTIHKKQVTVTANNRTVTYKEMDTNPLTYTAEGLIGEETLKDIKLSREVGTDAGNYAIHVSQREGSTENGNYDITFVNGIYTINPKEIIADITLSQDSYVYNGGENKPIVTIADPDDKENIEESEYTISYTSNVNAGTAKVTITDKENGNYIVSGEKEFTIRKKEAIVSADNKAKIYGEEDPKLTYKVTGLIGNETLQNINVSRATGEEVNTYKITPSAEESANLNYALTFQTGIFMINAKEVDNVSLSQEEYTYNKTAHQPDVIIKDGEKIVPASEYRVEYSDNINVGNGIVTIYDNEGGNYIVRGYKTFHIIEKSIEDSSILASLSQTEYIYNREEFKPTVIIEDIENERTTLRLAEEYVVDYENNRNAGIATVRITGINNYTGEIVKTFTINPKEIIANIALSQEDYTYNGEENKPEVTLSDPDDDEIIEKGEYSISYTSNVNAGIAKVIIIDKEEGNYIVNGEKEFTIHKKEANVFAENKEKVYGEEDPELTYTIQGEIEGEIFNNIEITREEGEEANTYKIIPSAEENDNPNYAITFHPGTLTIHAKEVDEIYLSQEEYSYNGTAHQPEITIKDGEKIVPASEYRVEYSNNINVGTGIVTIYDNEGGNYIVTGSKTFQIIDTTAPTIEGAEEGESYYKQVTLIFSDDVGVVKVTDNGEEITLTKENTYILKQDNKEHKITVYDLAGNETTRTIKVYQTYTVTFIVDGQVIETKEEVKYGDAIEDVPEIPTKEGYNEIDPIWDKELTNITSDLEVNAIYTKNAEKLISIDIPKELINTDPNVKRTYQIVKVENGVTTIIDVEEKDGKLHFETDGLTNYTIKYTDTPIITASKNPKTGDDIHIYAIAWMLSTLGIISMAINERRKRNQ